jgi:pimeloyl-ACP methyl ester carboxylesterase
MVENAEISLERVGTDSQSGALDLVFIHGLTGDGRSTWCNDNGFDFRDYLAREFYDAQEGNPVRAWSLGYPAPALQSGAIAKVVEWFKAERAPDALQGSPNTVPLTLTDRADTFLQLMGTHGIGTRPLVFVTHSLGGLIAKQILVRAPELLKNTRAVLFLATPHSGSALAGYFSQLSSALSAASHIGGKVGGAALGLGPWAAGALGLLLGKGIASLTRPSDLVGILQHQSSTLNELDEAFAVAVEECKPPVAVHAFREARGVGPLSTIIVEESSARPRICMRALPIEGATHTTICKPSSRSELVYRLVAGHVHRAIDEALGGRLRPVSHKLVAELVDRIRKEPTFKDDLPRVGWEERYVDDGRPPFFGIADLLVDGRIPNLRRRFAVRYYELCEAHAADDEALMKKCAASPYDFDQLLVIAAQRRRAELVLGDMRSTIERLCSEIRNKHRPTLTILYRALDSLDRTLDEQLNLGFAKDLRRTRDAIERRSSAESLDQDGVTRARIDDVLARFPLD